MTSLMKWDPFRSFGLFDDVFFKAVPSARAGGPEVQETENAFMIAVDMPGMEVTVDLDGDVLTLAGHRMRGEREDNRKYSYTLPAIVDKGGIAATYEQGVLRVTVPKLEEKARKPEMRSIKVDVK